jgi:hypothetical protein
MDKGAAGLGSEGLFSGRGGMGNEYTKDPAAAIGWDLFGCMPSKPQILFTWIQIEVIMYIIRHVWRI